MTKLLKILIADDDPFAVTLLQQELEHLGYEMGSCMNGQEALEAIVSGASELGFPGHSYVSHENPGKAILGSIGNNLFQRLLAIGTATYLRAEVFQFLLQQTHGEGIVIDNHYFQWLGHY